MDMVMYMTHKETHIAAVPYFEVLGPPNSPPIIILLAVKIAKQQREVPRNMATEKPSLPAGTRYTALLFA